jgi:RND family efflux transporter MFP subunit
VSKIWMACAVIGMSTCLSSCEKKEQQPAAPNEESALVVPVAKVGRGDLSRDIVLTAEFQPYQEVDVMAKVSGYVKVIKVDIGDRVKEGQLLATLEIPEMADEAAKAEALTQSAEAEIGAMRDEIRRAEAGRNMAHLSFTRIEEVSKKEKGLVPQQEVDDAQAHDLVAEAQVAEANSRLNSALQKKRVAQAEEARLKTMFQYTSITAPFAGVVTKRYANTGSMIQAGTSSQTQAMPLVRLSQNNVLRLVLPVPESATPRIRVGETLDVKVNTLARTFPGRVARFAGTLQMATRTMDTQVDVQNPGMTLVPGMYAEVNLNLEDRKNTLTVPIDAIEGSGTAAHVYVVRDSAVKSVRVTVGLETAQKVEILGGVEAGDMVILGRHSGLKDGEKVTPKLVGDES